MAGSEVQGKDGTKYPNLRAFTHEQAVEYGRKGGLASVQARRKQRTFRDSVKALIACDVQDPAQRKALEALGLDPTMLNQIQVAIYGKAVNGDTEAARYLRDTAGEKPREALELGNLDDKPLASLDLSKLTDDQLRALASRRAEEDAEGPEEAAD